MTTYNLEFDNRELLSVTAQVLQNRKKNNSWLTIEIESFTFLSRWFWISVI